MNQIPEKIVLASRNQKKIAELRDLLTPLGVEIVGLDAFPKIGEIEETGDSFAANATLKAETVCAATGLPALADDSGICIAALAGAPGIYAARFAGADATDAQNNAHMVERLREVVDDARGAKYACAIAYAAPNVATRIYYGETTGTIVHTPRGKNGFGYDPYFFSDDLQTTFAEATAEAKHAVSHRGRALAKFVADYKTRENA